MLSVLRIYVALTIFQSYLSAPAGFEPRAFGPLILNYLFFFSSFFFLLSVLRIYVALTIFQSYLSAPAGFEPRALGPLILNYLFFFSSFFFVKRFKDLRRFNDISVISFSASGIRTQSLRAIDPKLFIFFFLLFFLLSVLRIYVALTIFQSYLSAPAGFEPRAFGPLILNYLFFFSSFFFVKCFKDLRRFNDISVISFSASGIRTQSLRAIDPKLFIFFFFFFGESL